MAESGKTDKTVALLQLLGDIGGGQGVTGLHIVTVRTAEPDPVTLVMQGTKKALGLDIFEVPVECYPLREGDQLLAFPIIGGQRWGILAKLNGGLIMATMTSATQARPDSMQAVYDVIAPAFFPVANTASNGYLVAADIQPLKAGDRVSIAPTWDAGAEEVKYVILNRY